MSPGVNAGFRVPSLPLWVAVTSILVAPAWAMSSHRAVEGPAAPPYEQSRAAAGAGAAARSTRPFLLGDWARPALGAIPLNIFELALRAATCAVRARAVVDPPTLTVIDYSKPSTEKRLWVFDLRAHDLLYEELVAHGQGSGATFATAFSNEPETHRSSLGLFLTDDTYVGANGYSMRLDGLDAGFNDRARERAIVMHGASYVSAEFVRAQGRLGRSWGCPALGLQVARDLIDRVRGGSLLFAYYPDQKWLSTSKFLGDCSAAD